MRPAAILAVVLAATLASVTAHAEDRYGPPRTVAKAAAKPAFNPYSGPMLGWSNKVAPATPNGTPRLQQPEPLALARQFIRPTRVAPPPPPPPPPSEEPRPDFLEGRPSAPLPDSLYGGPPAAPQAPVPPEAPRAPEAARPQQLSAAPATPPSAGSPSRMYSVHRPYGLDPDAPPTPATGQNYVLIGPPDEPQGDADEDDDKPAKRTPERAF